MKVRNMRPILIIIFISTLFANSGVAQTARGSFQKTHETARNGNANSYTLVDHNGLIRGGFLPIFHQDVAGRIAVYFDSKKIEIPNAYSQIIINKEAKCLYNFGDYIDAHKSFSFSLKIIDLNGNVIASADSVGHYPACYAIANDGSFYFAGNTSYNENSTYRLKKFDKNGHLKWQKDLPGLLPTSISVSSDNNRIALNLSNPEQSQSELQIYSASGRIVRKHENLNFISGLEFSDQGLILISGNSFSWKENINDKSIQSAYSFTGVPVGKYPITLDQNGSIAYVITSGTSNKATLHAFDIQSGNLIAEQSINGNINWEHYRLIRSMKTKEISIILRDKTIDFKLNYL
jgi:DNA-binding beta-propeller fold protein YncE